MIDERVGAVSLSEHEQRLLTQLEQQLVAEDPKFASTMRGAHSGLHSGKRLAIGLIGVVLGLALIVAAVAQRMPVLAVPAFLLMLVGASYAFSLRKGSGEESDNAAPQPTRPGGNDSHSQDGLFNRLEERWERRREQGGNTN